MALPDLPPDRLDAAALRQALADGEREGIRAEYKREVGTDDRARSEWALDVSSFANTAGGILLVGAEESEGRLSALPGVPRDVDQEIQRLDSILRDRVDPAIPGVSIRPLDVNGHTVLVVSIPRSWRAPHLVRSGSRWHVARRTSAGKYVLQDAGEIRAAFAESADAGPRMRRWHDDRVAEVLAGEAPVELPEGPFMVVTVQPLGAGVPGTPPVIDIAALRADDPYRRIRPLHGAGDGPQVNVDGLLASASPGTDGRRAGYVQLYRDASLAYVDKKMFSKMFSRDRGVPGTAMVKNLLEGIVRSVAAVEWAGGALPVVVRISLHGMGGQLFHTDRSKHAFEEYSFDRDRIFLSEVIIDRALPSTGEAAVAIRPALDGLWNAVGWSRASTSTIPEVGRCRAPDRRTRQTRCAPRVRRPRAGRWPISAGSAAQIPRGGGQGFVRCQRHPIASQDHDGPTVAATMGCQNPVSASWAWRRSSQGMA